MKKTILLALTLALFAGACGPKKIYVVGKSMYGGAYKPHEAETATLTDGPLEVTIHKFRTGGYFTNVFVDIRVRNNGTSEAPFDPGQVELVFPTSGISYYHISRDKTTISTPVGMAAVMMPTMIGPGRAIEGTLMFATAQGAAKKIPAVQIIYNGQSLFFGDTMAAQPVPVTPSGDDKGSEESI